MILRALQSHPARPAPAGLQIHVECASRSDAGLSLHYRLHGDVAALRLPAPLAAPGCADGLWQYSCCELFIGDAGTAYREFNFSPSGEWAAYAFADYRVRRDWQAAAAPVITAQTAAGAFTLQVELPATLLPDGPLLLGVTAVIETLDGELSYWALTHAGEQPDFHRRESFTLAIQAKP